MRNRILFIAFLFLLGLLVTTRNAEATCTDFEGRCVDCVNGNQTCPGIDDVTGEFCVVSQSCDLPQSTDSCDCGAPNHRLVGCDSGSQCIGSLGDGCHYCATPICNNNGSQDNGETGVDCGGGGCPTCPVSCGSPQFQYNECVACNRSRPVYKDSCNNWTTGSEQQDSGCSNLCVPQPGPTCSDGVQNGNETGVDCGGSCPACSPPPGPAPTCEHYDCLASCQAEDGEQVNARKRFKNFDGTWGATCDLYFNQPVCCPVCNNLCPAFPVVPPPRSGPAPTPTPTPDPNDHCSDPTLFCNSGLSNCSNSQRQCGTCFYTTFTGKFCGVSYTNNTSLSCQQRSIEVSCGSSGGPVGGGSGGSCPYTEYDPPGLLCTNSPDNYSAWTQTGWAGEGCGCRRYGLTRRGGSSDCQQPTKVENRECSTEPPPPPPYAYPTPAWWQAKDADVTSQGTLGSSLPPGTFFSLDGAGGFPGIPIGPNITIPQDQISSRRWRAMTSYTGRLYNYDWFTALAPSEVFSDSKYAINDAQINGPDLKNDARKDPNGFAWHYRNGDLTINNNTILQQYKVILFVNGSLTINNNIDLNDGEGFFLVVAKNGITLSSNVSHPQQPSLEGFYITDGQFRTGTGRSRLWVRGSVAAQGGVVMQRDLEGGNSANPAELYEYAPDLIFTFPRALLRTGVVWREVAP